MGCDAVSPILKLGASVTGLGDLLRSYVDSVPQSAAAVVIASRSELVGPAGTREPLGVIAGMVFAMVTRASFPVHLKWFQSLDWRRAPRMLRALAPCSQEDKSLHRPRPGFDDLAQRESFGEQYGRLLVQPDDKSRVWGGNSSAALLMFECGYRMHVAADFGEGANSGLWLAAADPDPTVTVPGVAPPVAEKVVGAGCSEVQTNASPLGKVFLRRFGYFALIPSDAQELVKNACRYTERGAREAGFRRRFSRLAVPNSRAW